jgi:hypothetical protein
VLLLLDNHESHITAPVIAKDQENGVKMLTFPPHTRRMLQPLEKHVSGPFMKFHNLANSKWMLRNKRKPISIYSAAHVNDLAYQNAFSPSNIQFGYCVTGLLVCGPSNDIFIADYFYVNV